MKEAFIFFILASTCVLLIYTLNLQKLNYTCNAGEVLVNTQHNLTCAITIHPACNDEYEYKNSQCVYKPVCKKNQTLVIQNSRAYCAEKLTHPVVVVDQQFNMLIGVLTFTKAVLYLVGVISVVTAIALLITH